LFEAIRKGYNDIANLLIKHGSKLIFDGFTALQLAVCNQRLEIVKRLVEEGEDVNYMPQSETTLLALAVECGNVEIAKCLVSHGAKTDTRNGEGYTAAEMVQARVNAERKRAAEKAAIAEEETKQAEARMKKKKAASAAKRKRMQALQQ